MDNLTNKTSSLLMTALKLLFIAGFLFLMFREALYIPAQTAAMDNQAVALQEVERDTKSRLQ